MSELDPVLALGRIEDLLAQAHHGNGTLIEPRDQVRPAIPGMQLDWRSRDRKFRHLLPFGLLSAALRHAKAS